MFHTIAKSHFSFANDCNSVFSIGAPTSFTCRLCQAGTYWTGSGRYQPFCPEPRAILGLLLEAIMGVRVCLGPGSDSTSTVESDSTVEQALWSTGNSLFFLLGPCAEGQRPCLQAPPEQAPAASASLEHIRLAQVGCGLVYRDGATFLPAQNSTVTRRYCNI
jgi:hypothetical protein